jgi:hypothetical protein
MMQNIDFLINTENLWLANAFRMSALKDVIFLLCGCTYEWSAVSETEDKIVRSLTVN